MPKKKRRKITAQKKSREKDQIRKHLPPRRKKRGLYIAVLSLYDILGLVIIAATLGFFFYFIQAQKADEVMWTEIALGGEIIILLGLRVILHRLDDTDDPSRGEDVRRPNLSIEKTRLTLLPNVSPRVVLHVKNRGDVAARDVQLTGYWNVQRPNFNGTLTPILSSQQPDSSYPEAAPDTVFSVVIDVDRPVLPALCSDILAGKYLLFVFINVMYTDHANNPFSLTRYYMYRYDLKTLVVAPTKFQPRDAPDKRPELSIDLTKIIQLPDEPPSIFIQYRNAGRASAYKLRCEHAFYFRKATHASEKLPTPPRMDIDTIPTMRPKAIFSPSLTLVDLQPLLWQEIITGVSELFLLVKLSYCDDSGNFTYHLNTCHRYSTRFNHMMIAPYDIWPDGFNPET